MVANSARFSDSSRTSRASSAGFFASRSFLARAAAACSGAWSARRPALDLVLAVARPTWRATDDDVRLREGMGVGVAGAPVGDGAVSDTEPGADFDHVHVAVGRARLGRRAVLHRVLGGLHRAKLAGRRRGPVSSVLRACQLTAA